MNYDIIGTFMAIFNKFWLLQLYTRLSDTIRMSRDSIQNSV